MNALPAGWNEHVAYLVSERAYWLHTEGRFRESLALFEGLLEIDPDNLYLTDAVSAVYLSLGIPQESIRHASAIIASAPNYTNALVRRCEGYLLLGMRIEAARDLQRLKELGAQRQAHRMDLRLMAAGRSQTSVSRQPFSKLETRTTNPQLRGIEKR